MYVCMLNLYIHIDYVCMYIDCVCVYVHIYIHEHTHIQMLIVQLTLHIHNSENYICVHVCMYVMEPNP
jgi:hypothetical protein